MRAQEVRRGRAGVALAVSGILLVMSIFALAGRAAVTDVQIPIPNPTKIYVKASVTDFRYGGGDSLVLTVRVDVWSSYPAGTTSVLSARVIAYSDSNIDTATKYAQVGFHHVVLAGGESLSLTKTVRVHHASMAAMDHDAFLVATALNKVDGMALTAFDTATVDVAAFIAQL